MSTSSVDARKKGAVLQSTATSSSSSVMQVGILHIFLDERRSTTSNRFVLNMVQGHYLSA